MLTSIRLPDIKSIRNGLLDTTGRHYTHFLVLQIMSVIQYRDIRVLGWHTYEYTANQRCYELQTRI